MRHQLLLVLVAVVAVAGCGDGVPVVGGSPTTGADGACRDPLGPDDPSPLDTAGGPHPALEGTWYEPVIEQVSTGQVDGTAGVWLDQEAGEVVVMVTAEDGGAVLEQLRARVDADRAARITCMRAEHTMAELEDLQQQVMRRLADAGPLSSGIDTVRNRVEVSHEGDPSAVQEALGDLADHPALAVQRPECAEVVAPPTEAVLLPGDGSTCGGMDALLTGTLAGDVASACLWIEAEDGERVAIAWPRGWWVMPDGTVHDHRGQPRAQVGEVVAAGGGHVPEAPAPLPEGCSGGDGAFLLNSLDPAS